MAGAIAGGAAIGAGSAAVGGAIGMGVDAHVRGQAWSRQKNVLQKGIRWRVADLRAAGLNPILAAGVIPPPAAPAMMGSSSNLGGEIASGMAAGSKAAKVSKEKGLLAAQTEASTAQAFRNNAEGKNAEDYRAVIGSQAQKMASEARGAAATALQIEAELPRHQAEAELWTNPATRKIMQGKHMLEGTPLMRWNPGGRQGRSGRPPGSGPYPGRNTDTRPFPKSKHPLGPLIKGRK